MAKRPADSRSRPQQTNADLTKRRAERMRARLQRYHDLGHSELSTRELADQEGFSESTARKAKAFAASFTKADLKALLKLQRPDGVPIHWGYIPYILTVPSKGKGWKKLRENLLKEAAAKGWSAQELYRQIKNKWPDRRRVDGRGIGGRRRKHYDDPLEHARALLATVKTLQEDIDSLADSMRANPRLLKPVQQRMQWLVEALETAMVAANQITWFRGAGRRRR